MDQIAQPGRFDQAWTWFSQAIVDHDSFAGYFQPFIQLLLPQWSTDAFRAEVIEVRDELSDMYSLVLKPGPHFLDKNWPDFKPGQYVELMVEKDGARTLRCFSISSSPDYFKRTGLIELSIRVQAQGRITPWLKSALSKGGIVNVSAPKGDFLLSEELKQLPLLFIAGGSGITPFRSMLQQLAREEFHNADIQLMYYSRCANHIAFEQELKNINKQLPNVTVHFIDSEQEGFIDAQHVRRYCSDFSQRTAMICGPAPMIKLARRSLAELEVADDAVLFEYFGAPPIEIDAAEQGVVSFARSGVVSAQPEGEQRTLLEQAEAEGLNPVSGCRIGVCHQCICQKQSGVVVNTRTGETSDTGPGEVQLCVSVPVGGVVLDL